MAKTCIARQGGHTAGEEKSKDRLASRTAEKKSPKTPTGEKRGEERSCGNEISDARDVKGWDAGRRHPLRERGEGSAGWAAFEGCKEKTRGRAPLRPRNWREDYDFKERTSRKRGRRITWKKRTVESFSRGEEERRSSRSTNTHKTKRQRGESRDAKWGLLQGKFMMEGGEEIKSDHSRYGKKRKTNEGKTALVRGTPVSPTDKKEGSWRRGRES